MYSVRLVLDSKCFYVSCFFSCSCSWVCGLWLGAGILWEEFQACSLRCGRPGQGPSLHHASESPLQSPDWQRTRKRRLKRTEREKTYDLCQPLSLPEHMSSEPSTRVHIAVVVRMRLDTQYIHAERLWSGERLGRVHGVTCCRT